METMYHLASNERTCPFKERKLKKGVGTKDLRYCHPVFKLELQLKINKITNFVV